MVHRILAFLFLLSSNVAVEIDFRLKNHSVSELQRTLGCILKLVADGRSEGGGSPKITRTELTVDEEWSPAAN